MMNDLLDLKNKYGNRTFNLAIVLEVIIMMTDHYSGWTMPFRGRVTHVAFVLFCITILMTRYSRREYCLFLLLGIIGVISYFTCGDEYVIRAVAAVAASKNKNLKMSLKSILVVSLVGTAIIVIMSLIGIGGAVVDIRDYGRGIVESRYSFGFNHANNVHDMFWYIICIAILIHRERIPNLFYIVVAILDAVLYHFTISRTGFLIVLMLLMGCIICKYIRQKNIIYLMTSAGIILLAGIVFITLWASRRNIYMSTLVAKLDPILNGRLEMLSEHANMSMDGWLLFSNGRTAELVDNGFSVLFYTYGIAIAAVFIIAIVLDCIVLCKKQYKMELVVLITSILVFFMESTFMFNVSLLCNMLLIVFMVSINEIGEKCD